MTDESVTPNTDMLNALTKINDILKGMNLKPGSGVDYLREARDGAMTADEQRRIAERIADYLFVSGDGQQAERLILWRDSDGRDLGGWSKRALVNAIVRQLQVGKLPTDECP